MKHIGLFITTLFIGVILFSCEEKVQEDNTLQKERDSLLLVNTQQQKILDDMTSTMASISMSLDTIAKHESMIIRRVDETGKPLSKKDLKEKIAALSEYISNQREMMSEMEKDIADGKSSIVQLKSIIAYLNTSLEQKEMEIEQLKGELESKNYSIARLNTHVSNLKDTVESVRQENEEQRLQMERESAQHESALNEVFYIIGTKDQLIANGILTQTGAIFKKSKINFASIDKTVLNKGDKRVLKTIIINGKSPKILNEEPKGSYTLEKGSSTSTLTILDAEKFWSTNNRILVIQVK